MRCTTMILLMLALAACGAAPQAAAPAEKPTAVGDALATAVPAATAAQVAVPTVSLAVAPPTATSTPEESPMTRTTASSTTQPSSARTARPTPAVSRIPTAESTPGVVGEVPADLMDKILADAAQRSGVALASIVVQMGQAVEWPDGSLGCPKPGVAYLQVITGGYHVVLQIGASSYDYRADERGRFFVCNG